jgi:glucuronate isomerase
MTIGNPLYHWSHLELQRFFGISDLINEKNAPSIWEKVNEKLRKDGYSPRELIQKSNVKVICTTDDPTDSLEYHLKIKQLPDFQTVVLPSFRPDRGLAINHATFIQWVRKLEQAAVQPISTYDHFLSALESRVIFFHSVGCRVSDHALDTVVFTETTIAEVSAIFNKALLGQSMNLEDEKKYRTYTLLFLGRIYARFGWVMQLHINASRNNNTRLLAKLGPDTGFDSINDNGVSYPLVQLLDALDNENALPKTIVYSLNPKDLDVIGAIIGSFQGGGIPGKVQLGSAWWFNDTKDGMLLQMNALANLGLLSRFVGMLTDSRSFLSYTRHEYFRRILCNMLGEWVVRGEAPYDMELLGEMVQNISYFNANRYFAFADSTG